MQDALQNLRILEEELRASRPEEKQHIHFELDGEYVAMVDPFRRYVAVSDAVCRLLSFSRQELLTKKIDDVTAPNMRHSVPETFRKYVDIGFMTGTQSVDAPRRDMSHHPLRSKSLS
jgi:PAS domain-containing protein